LPATKFTPGETVTVQTGLNIIGGSGGAFQFIVANPAGGVPLGHRPPTPRVRNDVFRYRSRPDLVPAAVRVSSLGRTERGYVFIAPLGGPVQSGPMILDANGHVVWFKAMPQGVSATDLRVQSYLGKPVLTWWQGNINAAGIGQGEGVINDTSYRQIAVVKAANGFSADLHEFVLSGHGTAFITALAPVYWDASSVKGGTKDRIVLDSVVQEIDIKTGLVLFQWDSLDHVSLTDSYMTPARNVGHPYDYFHINSIAEDSAGNVIISSRDTWAAYKVDHHTGQVIWILGGKRSSFRMGPNAQFAYQHDVRPISRRNLTVFDDGGGPPRIHRQSRGLTLHLNFRHMTATVVAEDLHNPALVSNFEGNDQQLPGGGQMIGWGQQPYFTEFNSRGRMVFDGHFVGPINSYRAYRFRWTALPATQPAVAATGGRRTTVYASWNGANVVKTWRVLGGSSAKSLGTVGQAGAHGFETQITTKSEQYVEVQALDGRGRTLGTSAVVRVR
jgi:hypothetical protein